MSMPAAIRNTINNSDATRRSPLSRFAEVGLIGSFWICVALLTIAQQTFDPRFSGEQTWSSSEAAFTFLKYMIWVVLTPSIFWLIRSIGKMKQVWVQLALHGILGIAASAFVHYLYHVLWNVIVQESLQSMSFMYVFQGLHFLPEFFLYLVVLGAGFARDYFLRYRERLQETARLQAESARLRADAAELEAQLADARLQALRMQIHPHFLFNTLHMVSAYIERDPAGSRRIITLLGDMLRYTLEQTETKEAPLSRELTFLNKYFEIQSIRFKDRLEIVRRVEPDALEALVPTLILQPLAENAIKHGISPLESRGRITLSARVRARRLYISIEDNGAGLAGSSGDGAGGVSPGIGLQNTRMRLASLYRDEHSLTLENSPEGGAIVHLTLPFHTQSDLHTTAI